MNSNSGMSILTVQSIIKPIVQYEIDTLKKTFKIINQKKIIKKY